MSLIPILADVIFSPFDLAWYYAGRYLGRCCCSSRR